MMDDEAKEPDVTLEQALWADMTEDIIGVPSENECMLIIARSMVGILAELKRLRYAHDAV